jgi:hypothetical protein
MLFPFLISIRFSSDKLRWLLRSGPAIVVSYRHIVLVQKPGKISPLDAEMPAGELESRQLSGVNPAQYGGIAHAAMLGDKTHGHVFRCPLLKRVPQTNLPSALLSRTYRHKYGNCQNKCR